MLTFTTISVKLSKLLHKFVFILRLSYVPLVSTLMSFIIRQNRPSSLLNCYYQYGYTSTCSSVRHEYWFELSNYYKHNNFG
jgi:hypothetical protein